MPIYEYRCNQCGAEFEALQKMSDPPLQECRHCGAADVTKLVSAPSFRLGGTGWYETDFKSDQDKKKNLAASDNANGSADSAKEGSNSSKAGDSAQASGKDTKGTDSKGSPGKSPDKNATNKSTAKKTDKNKT